MSMIEKKGKIGWTQEEMGGGGGVGRSKEEWRVKV